MLRSVLGALVALVLVGSAAGVAAADPPEEAPFSVTITDVNPCTGELHDLTFAGAVRLSGAQALVSYDITTTSGYEGQGRIHVTLNGRVDVQVQNDMTRGPNGNHIRVNAVLVVDLDGGEVVVERRDGPLCTRPVGG